MCVVGGEGITVSMKHSLSIPDDKDAVHTCALGMCVRIIDTRYFPVRWLSSLARLVFLLPLLTEKKKKDFFHMLQRKVISKTHE